jgi:hypothetical protein
VTTTHIIGDVHGCDGELEELLSLLRPDARFVFVGDLVDKGPDSAAVVRRVRKLAETRDVTLITGNHEETFLRWLSKAPEARQAMKRHEMYASYGDDLSDADVAFLQTSVPYLKVEDPRGASPVLVTHAGVPFEIEQLPDDPRETAGWSRKQRKYVDRMCRLRYVDADWKFVSLDDVEPHHTYWADGYDGRFGTVVYGHEPYLLPQPVVHIPEGGLGPYNVRTTFRRGIARPTQRAIGVDLGCVFGGYLCALTLGSGHWGYTTVKAYDQYAEPLEGRNP